MSIALAPEEATEARILDAAFECAQRFGLGRTTMGDVAAQARLSRQTVYRYFPTKHELFGALILREEQTLIRTVQRAMEPHDDLQPAMRAAFEACLRAMRAHPLLDKVMTTEPHELLPYLTVDANPVLEMSTKIMEQVLTGRVTRLPPKLRHRFAETCARVFTSYAITPPDGDAKDIAEELAELFCGGLDRWRKR